MDAGTEAAFDVAAVDPDGARTALKAKLRLVRERPDWRLVMNGSLARYETVWRDEPLETRAIDIPADAPLRVARTLDFGRYRIEVLEDGGMAGTSMRFRAGWVSSDNPDVPDQVDVAADRKAYAPGDTASIHIAPPFAAEATLLVLSDRVHSVRNLAVPVAGDDVDVPVLADWGTGAYVTVHVFRTAATRIAPQPSHRTGVGRHRSGRAQAADGVRGGLPSAAGACDPAAHRPRRQVSLAAVDEGILRLTKFASPDPSDQPPGRRQLVSTSATTGALRAPPDARHRAARRDEGGFAPRTSRRRR